MKTTKFLLSAFIALLIAQALLVAQDAPNANPLTVDISRRITKELLGPNSIPFIKPLVVVSNATANSRFFRQAFIPKKVDKAYFKVGVHSMVGFVREDQKTYTPIAPTATLSDVLSDTSTLAVTFLPTLSATVKDTAGLITNILKYLFYKGLGADSAISGMTFPTSAATIFGHQEGKFTLSNQYFLDQLHGGDSLLSMVFKLLSPAAQASIDTAVRKLPQSLALPTGGNVSTVLAAIPQLEIGALWGTELLIRFIPPIEIDKNIGKFAFWGIGLKHSISQYLSTDNKDEKPWCDAALQVVYQGSSLSNKIGVTNAELSSDATIWDANIQASKSFSSIVDVFMGVSLEQISITTSYKYYLPVEIQMDLGLLPKVPVGVIPKPEPGYPGDTKPQTVSSTIKDTNLKFIIGLAKEIGPIAVFADYSFSKFNVITGGVEVRF